MREHLQLYLLPLPPPLPVHHTPKTPHNAFRLPYHHTTAPPTPKTPPAATQTPRNPIPVALTNQPTTPKPIPKTTQYNPHPSRMPKSSKNCPCFRRENLPKTERYIRRGHIRMGRGGSLRPLPPPTAGRHPRERDSFEAIYSNPLDMLLISQTD